MADRHHVPEKASGGFPHPLGATERAALAARLAVMFPDEDPAEFTPKTRPGSGGGSHPTPPWPPGTVLGYELHLGEDDGESPPAGTATPTSP